MKIHAPLAAAKWSRESVVTRAFVAGWRRADWSPAKLAYIGIFFKSVEAQSMHGRN